MQLSGRLAIMVVFVAAQVACAQAAPPAAKPAPTLNTEKLASTELARDLIDGRVGVLFHVARFRFHPAGAAIGQLGRWGDIVEALGLDPLADVDRAFVTTFQASDLNTINVLELNASDERVRAGFRALGGSDSSATFDLKNGPDVFVALVSEHRLVSAPLTVAPKVWALGKTEPLPRPEKKEAARFFAFEPYATLGSPPSWPSTLLLAQAEIEIVRGGGATVRFEAMSSSEGRARLDAAALTAEAKRLLAVDIGLFDLEVLSPPVFHSNGRRVLMETQLLPTDVDWLIRFSGGLMARSLALVATLSFLSACAPALRVAVGRQAPAAEPAPYLEHATCPRSQVPFDEAALRLKQGPPAIPGDDGAMVRISVVDASNTFDLVRISVEAEAPTGNNVLFISDEQVPVTHIAIPAGVAPTLRVHAIVRPAVSHGMFRNVSVCFDKWSTFALRATDSEIPLKLEDGDDASAPGQWSLFSVDTFHLRPSERRGDWDLEHIEHVVEPRD